MFKDKRNHKVLAAVVFISLVGIPPLPAAPVDRTGLDILCKGPGDAYIPPNSKGISYCVYADGQVVRCDSKTDKCTSALTGGDAKSTTVVEGAVTLRLLKLLNDSVNDLKRQVEALTAEVKKRPAQ